MDTFFVGKLIVAFVAGGLYIPFCVWATERFGSRFGGLLIGLPSTTLISFLFIAWTQDPNAAVMAAAITPAALAASGFFLVEFFHFYHLQRKMMTFLGIFLWFALILPLVIYKITDIRISLLIAVPLLAILLFYFRKHPNRKLDKVKAENDFMYRFVFSGSVIMVAVYLGKTLGPIWGGVFAAFPAAFMTSFILLDQNHGKTFSIAAAKSAIYGTIATILFAVVFYYAVPVLGLILGTMIAYLAAVGTAFLMNKFILIKIKEEVVKSDTSFQPGR